MSRIEVSWPPLDNPKAKVVNPLCGIVLQTPHHEELPQHVFHACKKHLFWWSSSHPIPRSMASKINNLANKKWKADYFFHKAPAWNQQKNVEHIAYKEEIHLIFIRMLGTLIVVVMSVLAQFLNTTGSNPWHKAGHYSPCKHIVRQQVPLTIHHHPGPLLKLLSVVNILIAHQQYRHLPLGEKAHLP